MNLLSLLSHRAPPRGRILVYHRVCRAVFLRQLRFLQHHFDLVSLSEAIHRLHHPEQNRDRRPFAVITLDDGFRDVLDIWEDLLRLEIPACLYIPITYIGQPGHLRWDELKQVARWFDIGSHSLTHRRLRGLSPKEIMEELRGSKQRLEDRLGQPVRHFAAPYGGKGSFTRMALQAAAEVGYVSYRTTFRGWNRAGVPGISGLTVLKADPVYTEWPLWRFRLTLAGALDWKHRRPFHQAVAED